tara:strand:+ start:786 stop:980 length:195 start_codon:yes stop_codon:yes gene_type:complete
MLFRMTKKRLCVVCEILKKTTDFKKKTSGGWTDWCRRCHEKYKESKNISLPVEKKFFSLTIDFE